MGLYLKSIKKLSICVSCWLNRDKKRQEYGLAIHCQYSNSVIMDGEYLYGGIIPTCGIEDAGKHGRLIDANALTDSLDELLRHCAPDSQAAQRTRETLAKIRIAPTVISAEK